MIHSAETIKRIRTLLTNAGVPKGEVLEEMLDHYLSDIEYQVERQTSSPQAIEMVAEKIQQTDFRHLKQRKRLSLPLILAALLLLPLAFYPYQCQITQKEPEIVKKEEALAPQKSLLPEDEAPNGWPLEGTVTPVTSNFGMRMHPTLKTLKLHKGIDIRAKSGTPVLATGNAVVQEVGFAEKTGKYIILKHNNTFSSRYCHLSAIHVKENEKVTKGSVIGAVGNTGAGMAPHLHYEIMDSGDHIDPLEYIRT